MIETIEYRLAVDADFDRVYEMYMDEASNPYLTYDEMNKQEFENIFKDVLPTGSLYVGLSNNEVIATYRLIQKTFRQSHTIYLGGFVIHSDYKGQGIGKNVLYHIRDESLQIGITRIELTVSLENAAAIALYKKVGFEIEGVIKNSYKLSSTGKYYDEYLMGWLI